MHRKVRRLGLEQQVVGGIAGSAADGITLFERLENQLERYPGQLRRSAVELAKTWRQEKALRQLDAVLLVADKSTTLMVTGAHVCKYQVTCLGGGSERCYKRVTEA